MGKVGGDFDQAFLLSGSPKPDQTLFTYSTPQALSNDA